MEVSFLTCMLDDIPVHLRESRTYQNALKYYGPEFADQFIVEYVVRLKDEDE